MLLPYGFAPCLVERHERPKIRKLEAFQPHGTRNTQDSGPAKPRLSLTYQLQINRRAEARKFRELAPHYRRARLLVAEPVAHEGVIVLVCDYGIHLLEIYTLEIYTLAAKNGVIIDTESPNNNYFLAISLKFTFL